jgi:hypothetical protein
MLNSTMQSVTKLSDVALKLVKIVITVCYNNVLFQIKKFNTSIMNTHLSELNLIIFSLLFNSYFIHFNFCRQMKTKSFYDIFYKKRSFFYLNLLKMSKSKIKLNFFVRRKESVYFNIFLRHKNRCEHMSN